jgi:16S rRNA (cytosine1402-N4)-methyltransferase
MVGEALQLMRVRAGGKYVDTTLGGGGYAEKILEALGPDGLVLGIDQDAEAIAFARQRLKDFPNFRPIHDNFSRLGDILDAHGIGEVNGIVFDLGVSSHLLDQPERGFSFQREGPLDMRMDQDLPDTAEHLVNDLSRPALEEILREYGEEPFASRIVRAIIDRRQVSPLKTTKDLADLIYRAYPRKLRYGRTHPATRAFQALRIAVNDELTALQTALASGLDRLAPDGVLCCVSYHSLEDRIVKQFFQRHKASRYGEEQDSRALHILTPKPLVPSDQEVANNSRARSAKLRAAARVAPSTEPTRQFMP